MENGMPAQEGQQAPEQQQGDLSEVVFGIQKQMVALLATLDQSQAIDSQGKAQLANIIKEYQNFVEQKLGAPAGQEEGPAPQESAPPEAAGNPNARPM